MFISAFTKPRRCLFWSEVPLGLSHQFKSIRINYLCCIEMMMHTLQGIFSRLRCVAEGGKNEHANELYSYYLQSSQRTQVPVVDECPLSREKSKKTGCRNVWLHLTTIPQMKAFRRVLSVGVTRCVVYTVILKNGFQVHMEWTLIIDRTYTIVHMAKLPTMVQWLSSAHYT